MSQNIQGITIGIERVQTDIFIKLKASGTLTHDDYQIITPILESALAGIKQVNVKVLLDATEFEGWELRAAWDDFKLGLKHGNEFGKIAIVGDQHWQQKMAKLADWFISGEIKYFDSKESAMKWLF